MAVWHDRSWIPTEEEQRSLGLLRDGHLGQILLRVIDQQMLDDVEAMGLSPTEYPEEYTIAQMYRSQGAYRALNAIKMRLLAEPQPIEEPNE